MLSADSRLTHRAGLQARRRTRRHRCGPLRTSRGRRPKCSRSRRSDGGRSHADRGHCVVALRLRSSPTGRSWPGTHDEFERMVHAAEEDLVDARLALGQHDELLARIEALLVEAEPLNERRRGQLMTALYRCGRQADALEAYQQARRALVDALGSVSPSELRRIESDILGQSLPDAGPLPPCGVVTFLLTDVEGRSRMWGSACPADAMAYAIACDDEIVRDLVARNDGMLRKTRGEGDSTFSVFVSATNASKPRLCSSTCIRRGGVARTRVLVGSRIRPQTWRSRATRRRLLRTGSESSSESAGSCARRAGPCHRATAACLGCPAFRRRAARPRPAPAARPDSVGASVPVRPPRSRRLRSPVSAETRINLPSRSSSFVGRGEGRSTTSSRRWRMTVSSR